MSHPRMLIDHRGQVWEPSSVSRSHSFSVGKTEKVALFLFGNITYRRAVIEQEIKYQFISHSPLDIPPNNSTAGNKVCFIFRSTTLLHIDRV